jgi:predicted transcriptional regulator
MDLTEEEMRFLEILSDGNKKTYVHVVKGFGMPLTPMAPTFTNRIAKHLLELGLVQRAGWFRDGYSITAKGLEVLQHKI